MNIKPMLPPGFASFEAAARAAFEEWCPEAKVKNKPLGGGLSGSPVLRTTITGNPESGLSGAFVLKLSKFPSWKNQDTELHAHSRAEAWNEEFAQRHIPALRKSFQHKESNVYAMLFDPAGYSFDAYLTASEYHREDLGEIYASVLQKLLRNWSANEPGERISPYALLGSWLGYRLKEDSALRNFADRASDGPTLSVGSSRVPNPMYLLRQLADDTEQQDRPAFKGLLHRDLHTGNILVDRNPLNDSPFFIIDLALSEKGYIGFDQAYLEIALLLKSKEVQARANLFQVVNSLSSGDGQWPLPGKLKLVKMFLQVMRNASQNWIKGNHPNWQDAINRQFNLARVAAGLNWASKGESLPNKLREMAFLYSGIAARDYLKSHNPSQLEKIWSLEKTGTSKETTLQSLETEEGDQSWKQLQHCVQGFDGHSARFILVAEALREGDADSPIESIGYLPWSVIVDLDPSSEEEGLMSAAEANLERKRGLHKVREDVPEVNFDRGTLWLLAAGSSEKKCLDYNSWMVRKLKPIRSAIGRLDESSKPLPLYVLVIRGGHLDEDKPDARISSVIRAIFEASSGRAQTFVVGKNPVRDLDSVEEVSIELPAFARSVENNFALGDSTSPTIPSGASKSGRVEVPIEKLRALQENVDLLHSHILKEEREHGGETNAFWRGHPPSWNDLHLELDVEREMQTRLVDKVNSKLSDRSNETIILTHQPGAGGTTVALRAAWMVHQEYPTAIVRKHSSALASRLHDLYKISQKPILLVSESANLTESAREELYRSLVKQGTNVVMLHVRRHLSPSDNSFSIVDPLSNNEAKSFRKVYINLTDDLKRKNEINRITKTDSLKKYRTPFFYGLVTYERDFDSVDTYVQNHLDRIAGSPMKVRKVLEYLAVVTMYSDAGVPEKAVHALMDIPDGVEMTLDEVLGSGPARLVNLRNNQVRILHQVIAEEILDCFNPGAEGEWQKDLKHLSISLIRDIINEVGPDSDAAAGLFRQLFIDRVGMPEEETDGPTGEKPQFAPIIERIDRIDSSLGHEVLKALVEYMPREPHFWNHLGRHQMYALERDLDKAADHLMHAIDLSNDFIHYHTLGTVLGRRVRNLGSNNDDLSAEDLLNLIEGEYSKASEAFEESRKINPESIAAYTTHASLIISVVFYLRRASGTQNLAEIASEDRKTREWVSKEIARAEELLESAQMLYRTLDKPNEYITRGYEGLRKLYGNLDGAVRVWEEALSQGLGTASGHRSLARAYIARRDRKWRKMQSAELRRVRELMRANLRSTGGKQGDLKLWFRAARLLSDFQVDEALAEIQRWDLGQSSWYASYYTYVLHFLLWFSGRSENFDQMQDSLELSRQKYVGRRALMVDWIAKSPDWCPLIGANELGEWNRERGFWKRDGLLHRVNGIISEDTNRVQAGSILIDGKVEAFFVPAAGGFSPDDRNEKVNFFLGFTAEGPKAWDVERGHVENGGRQTTAGNKPRVFFSETRDAESEKRRIKKTTPRLRPAKLNNFIYKLVRAFSETGAKLSVEQLKLRTDAAFGCRNAVSRAFGKNINQYLIDRKDDMSTYKESGRWHVETMESARKGKSSHETKSIEGVVTEYDSQKKIGTVRSEHGEKFYISLNSFSDKSEALRIQENQLISFLPYRHTAIKVSVLPFPSEDEVRSLADDHIWEMLQSDLADGKAGSTLKSVENRLAKILPYKQSPAQAMGVDIRRFVEQMRDCDTAIEDGEVYVYPKRALGRVPPPQ